MILLNLFYMFLFMILKTDIFLPIMLYLYHKLLTNLYNLFLNLKLMLCILKHLQHELNHNSKHFQHLNFILLINLLIQLFFLDNSLLIILFHLPLFLISFIIDLISSLNLSYFLINSLQFLLMLYVFIRIYFPITLFHC